MELTQKELAKRDVINVADGRCLGKIVDASEGGDDVKSNFAPVTPYNGIHRHEKIGQKIQKEE